MEKREQNGNDKKIILFPGLERRLLENGLRCLEDKNYREAIPFLEETLTLSPDNSEAHIGLVLAYFETGSLRKAKSLAKEMLQTGIGDYVETVDLYLMILVQLGEYEEIVATIEVLLEEREIPVEKYEHFSSMLALSKRMTAGNEDENQIMLNEEPAVKSLDLFSQHDQHNQVLLAARLGEMNIRPFRDEILTYLQSETGSDFFKTLLLNVLNEHAFDKEISLHKTFGEMTLIPSELFSLDEHEQMNAVLQILKEKMYHENPTLYDHVKEVIMRHLFILFPFSFEKLKNRALAAAYHLLVLQYHGTGAEGLDIGKLYEVEFDEIIAAEQKLSLLEEISFLKM